MSQHVRICPFFPFLGQSCLGLFFLLQLWAIPLLAQINDIDKAETLRQLKQSKSVEQRVQAMNQLQLFYAREGRDDSVYHYFEEGLQLARKHKHAKLETVLLGTMGSFYVNKANYTKALSYFFQSLRLAEKQGDSLSHCQLLLNIGGAYLDLDDPKKAIEYTKASVVMANQINNTFFEAFGLVAIASYFNELNQPDSALGYLQEGILLVERRLNADPWMVAFTQCELGNYNRLKGNGEIARSYFLKSLQGVTHSDAPESATLRAYNYLGLSEIAEMQSETLAAIDYARLAIASLLSWKNAKMLQIGYNQIAGQFSLVNKDSAIWYYQKALSLRDSMMNLKNLNEIKNMTEAEEERLRERSEMLEAEAAQARAILEYAAVGLVTLLSLLLFLLLSSSILVNQKWVRFLGVMVLLIFFEFINLLLHPLLGSATHHSPGLMLLGMVMLAALLVPTHHRLEKWLLHKVIEKNKRIRLKTAKQILSELDEKPDKPAEGNHNT